MKEINVAVTGGAGQIAYSLLPRLVSGETFGSDTKVNLRLIEIPQVVDKLLGFCLVLLFKFFLLIVLTNVGHLGFKQVSNVTASLLKLKIKIPQTHDQNIYS